MKFEDFLIMLPLIIIALAVIIGAFFVPVTLSYTLKVDGVEYECVDFDVERDCIELFDHGHGSLYCSEKCSRQYIDKAEKTFEVIPHNSSIFERIKNK